MWETLGALAVAGGPWGLVGFGVLSLMRGWLIPGRTHDRIVSSLERQLAAEERRTEEYKAQAAILLAERVPQRRRPGPG